ncbi:MAG: hypothetical protein R6X02_34795 [Enhygromyxa sp.]
MTSAPSLRRLGDVGAHAPDATWWTDVDHDAMLLIYAANPEQIAELVAELIAGVELVGQQDLHLPFGGREPFGFVDGIANIRIPRADQAESSDLPVGEVLLGHLDATGATREPGPLGQHGSLVVVRQLEQDVARFWSFWIELGGSAADAIHLAAKAMGRWPNGMPCKPDQTRQPPAREQDLEWTSFLDDPLGHGCPYGAHVRRANPRDTLVEDAELSRKICAQHLLLRRGRVYGPPAPPAWYPEPLRAELPSAGSDAGPRGLMFIALCSDLRRQFEFVMQNWLIASKHADLFCEIDPILAHEGTTELTIPGQAFSRHMLRVGGWVRPRGGGYYLMPARDALIEFAHTS